MTLPRADLDSPWKDILRAYFPQAMQFFFPNTAALIDWGRSHEFLDKEFIQIAREGELGRRYADQLVKVWLKDGAECWLIVHLEVQSQSESGFEERMFVYSFRIFDLFRRVPVSLAILCDESPTWRPQRYGVDYPDTRLNFEFGVVKLLDWRDFMDELESSDNAFATVVLTHLKVHETKRSSQNRKAWKFRLTKALYEKGYERQQILDLYRFIDWAMILPEAVEQEFWQELQAFEEERKVTYVTNAERFGFERGMREGLQHEKSLILRQLTRRLGQVSPEAEAQVRGLSLPQLEALGEALLDFSQSEDLGEWLSSR